MRNRHTHIYGPGNDNYGRDPLFGPEPAIKLMIDNLAKYKFKNKMITTPKDMKFDHAEFDRAVGQFEHELTTETKGHEYYFLTISGELCKSTCNEIERLYLQAGWDTVKCSTSSDAGERPGLTSLKLTTTIE